MRKLTTRQVPSRGRLRHEHGQATIALAGVLALAALAVMVLSVFGQAIVHRARARNAADSVALAAAVDATAAHELQEWYAQQNIAIEYDGTRTIARSGPSQAAAWASTQPAPNQPAPVLVAIIARAEQLLNTAFTSMQWQSTTVSVSASDAANLRIVATELGLCESDTTVESLGGITFEMC